MTKTEFREFIRGKIVYLDGATGSNIQRGGFPPGVCPELWITEHEEALIQLQREYINAGSNIIYAPTFSANRIKLAGYGLADRLKEINTCLVKISRRAAEGRVPVAGDLTMTGALLEPLGDLTFEELCDIYREQISAVAEAGADLLVIETMMSLSETRAALLAARDVSPDLPIMATLTFTESGNTLYGASAESAVLVLQSLGADAVGLNCSAGPDKMIDVVRRMKRVAAIPVIAKPNAGLPQMSENGETIYSMDADTFAGYMCEIVNAGAQILGGCCGTTPEYIERLCKETAGMRIPQTHENDLPVLTGISDEPSRKEEDGCKTTDKNLRENAPVIYLANERNIFAFAEGQKLQLGDGIDFRTDGDLLAEYQDEIFDTAEDMAFDLQDDEADALLFCACGLEDEAEILLAAIADVTGVVQLPVAVASADPSAVERILREYSGVMAVMPMNENMDINKEIENKIKLYGAKVLTLDKEIRCC